MRKFNHGHKKSSGAQLLSASMPLMLSGTDAYTTEDNENFSAGGSTSTQINHLVWQGLPGVYLAATANGLMKTVDGGQTWDYLRPNATFGGDWPAGSVGRQVAFAMGPRTCPENEPPAEGCSEDGLQTIEQCVPFSDTSIDISTDTATISVTVPQPELSSYFLVSLASHQASSTPNVPDISDNTDITWSEVETVVYGTNNRLTVWIGKATEQAIDDMTFDITFTFANAQDGMVFNCDQLVGSISNPIIQSATEDNVSQTNPFAVTLPAAKTSGSFIWSVAAAYDTGNDLGNDVFYYENHDFFGVPNTCMAVTTGQLSPGDGGLPALSWLYSGGLPSAAIGIEFQGRCGGMFIVANDDVFSFNGTTVTPTIVDDPNQRFDDRAFCLKSYGGKLFWHGENPSSEAVIMRSEDNGLTSIIGGTLAPAYISQFDIDPNGVLYAIVSDASDSLYKSTDDGDTWTLVIGSLEANTYRGAVACHPTDANRIAFIELSDGTSADLRVSTNAGASFSSLALDVPVTGFNHWFGFQPRWRTDGRLVWVFQENFGDFKVQWSDDDGASVAGSQVLNAFGVWNSFDGMWIDADDVLYVSAFNNSDETHIFRSPDGSTWTDMGVLGDNLSRVQGMALTNDTIYVLNDALEIWKISSPGTSWSPELIASIAGTLAVNQDAFTAMVN